MKLMPKPERTDRLTYWTAYPVLWLLALIFVIVTKVRQRCE